MNSSQTYRIEPLLPNGSVAGLDIEGREQSYRRACVAMRRADYEAAAREALVASEGDEAQPEACYLAGAALMRAGQVDMAEQVLLKAVALRSDYADAHLALAHLYRRHRRDFFRLGKHQHLAAQSERLRERVRPAACMAA